MRPAILKAKDLFSSIHRRPKNNGVIIHIIFSGVLIDRENITSEQILPTNNGLAHANHSAKLFFVMFFAINVLVLRSYVLFRITIAIATNAQESCERGLASFLEQLKSCN